MPASYVTLDGNSIPVRVEDNTYRFHDPFFNGNFHKDHATFPRDTSDTVLCGFAIFVFAIFIGSCCFNCLCKWRKQKETRIAADIYNPPVVVTSATHTAPGGYPVTTVPAGTYQANTFGAPYPAQTTGPNVTVQMPMPMPSAQPAMPGMQPHVAPYPPVLPHAAPYPAGQQFPGAGAANMNPPSYDAAMANAAPSVVPAGYEKQMPYNPNY